MGPGRGSAAGSIVAYALEITDIDPLANDLLFERFLNPGRKSMPDIDIDFSVRGREQVIRYVADKYGRDCVAQIITFGKMAPRAATRDAARVLGYDYATGDRLAKQIPEPILGRTPSFDECLKPGEELKRTYDSDPDARRILDTAQGLEGIVRNHSIHAAAVVIADRPLQEIVPLQLAEDRAGGNGNGNGKAERAYKTVTQYSMGPIEEIGLLKMDFLGLRNLDVIEDAVAIIERSRGERIDIKDIPLDDPKTFQMLSRGDSIGVFQFESDGMRDALKTVRPTEFQDLVALVSLYRPGAMRYIGEYARGKGDPASVGYRDPRLRPITQSTYGCVIYQEQLMEIAKQMAGFTPAEADDLRKAIGKKKRDLMATMREKFLEGLGESNTDRRVAQDLWSLMEAAADYSFNRSHAACYALIAYRTAWLRANYPAEYMAALISTVMSTKDKVPFFVNRCARWGSRCSARREQLGPRLRRLREEHPVRPGRGEERWPPGGPGDPRRAQEGRRVHLDLGLLRARRHPRRQQARGGVPGEMRGARLDRSLTPGDARGAPQRDLVRSEGAGGLADGPGLDLRPRRGAADAGEGPSHHHPPIITEEFDQRELPAREGDARDLPLFPSARRREGRLKARVDCSLSSLGEKQDGSWVTVGGIVTEFKRHTSKNGSLMSFATLDDVEGQVELLVMGKAYEASREFLAVDAIVIVRGRLDHKGRGETKLVAQEVELFEPTEDEVTKGRRARPDRSG